MAGRERMPPSDPIAPFEPARSPMPGRREAAACEPFVAAVCGLRAEARIARRLGWRAAAAGGDAAATRAAAERLVAEGATLLVSFGICGGLDPALAPGAVVLADRVLVADRVVGTPLRLEPPGGLRGAAILGAAEAAATPAVKDALFRTTGAAAVDLESGIVAAVATRSGVPFLALRAVADPAVRSLPPAALIPLRRDGTPDLRRILGEILRRPGQIPALIRVAGDARAALGALERAAVFVNSALPSSQKNHTQAKTCYVNMV